MRVDRTRTANASRRRRQAAVRAPLPAIKISVAHAGPPPAHTSTEEIKELRGALALAKSDHDELLAQELEMREDLEISRHRYAQLFDTAPVGYAVLDRAG